MLTDTQELLVFQAVAKHASYARAAEELGLSPSGVSRIVSRLEERLGARLLHRTTRKLSLTEAGAAFHARTTQILADLADAEAEVQNTVARPKGTLKVTASVMFGQLYLAPLLPELLDTFPELSVEMSLTNRFVDLVEEGIDLAIRIGSLADSRLVARRLCTNRRVLVAAPGYLKRHGKPKTVDELARHQCVLFTAFARPSEWKLIGPDGPVTVSVSGRVATNNVETLTTAAKQGLGITVGATLSWGRPCWRGSWCACSATMNSSRPPCSPSFPRRASCRRRRAPPSTSWPRSWAIRPPGIRSCAARCRFLRSPGFWRME